MHISHLDLGPKYTFKMTLLMHCVFVDLVEQPWSSRAGFLRQGTKARLCSSAALLLPRDVQFAGLIPNKAP